MHTRRRLALIAAAALWVGSAVPTLAADNGTVDAQVAVATPCILVTPATLDFGTLPFSTVNTQGQGSKSIHVENCGGSEEQLYARGTDAYNANLKVWSLFSDTPCSAGLNQYKLRVAGTGNIPFLILSTTSVLLESVAGGSAAGVSDLQVSMPCAGSNGTGLTMSFQALFTATF